MKAKLQRAEEELADAKKEISRLKNPPHSLFAVTAGQPSKKQCTVCGKLVKGEDYRRQFYFIF